MERSLRTLFWLVLDTHLISQVPTHDQLDSSHVMEEAK